jgi:preprotein translocase subunit SecG
MILAQINWLGVVINLLLVVHVLVALLMVLVILMQRPKQEGLGAAFGSGVTDSVWGARTTNVLQKATVYLGSSFFVLTLVLAILIGQRNKTVSLVNKGGPAQQPTAEVSPLGNATSPAEQVPSGGPAQPGGEPVPADANATANATTAMPAGATTPAGSGPATPPPAAAPAAPSEPAMPADDPGSEVPPAAPAPGAVTPEQERAAAEALFGGATGGQAPAGESAPAADDGAMEGGTGGQ